MDNTIADSHNTKLYNDVTRNGKLIWYERKSNYDIETIWYNTGGFD